MPNTPSLWALLSVLLCCVSPCLAQTTSKWNPAWDPDFALATRASLKVAMERNPKNAVVLFKMVEKAKVARYGDTVLHTLDSLCNQYPESADAAAAYCWAYKQDVDTAYIKGGDYRDRRPEEERRYETLFRRTKQLGYKHWLAKLVEGYVSSGQSH